MSECEEDDEEDDEEELYEELEAEESLLSPGHSVYCQLRGSEDWLLELWLLLDDALGSGPVFP